MAFIGDCPDVAMLEDVLIAILDLLRHTPPGRVPLLAGMSGAQLFVSLLSREQPALRILGLHLLAHFVPYIQSGGYIFLLFIHFECCLDCLESCGLHCLAVQFLKSMLLLFSASFMALITLWRSHQCSGCAISRLTHAIYSAICPANCAAWHC